MKILCICDVVGPCGVDFLRKNLYNIAKKNSIDMIIANGAEPTVLYDITDGKKVGTRFVGRK